MIDQAVDIGEVQDVEWFEASLREHDARMRALAFRMTGDRAAMDDVLQEAYLKAWRGLGSFRGEAAFGTWLHRIVTTTCLDHLRRRARRHEDAFDEAEEVLSAPNLPADSAGRLDLAAALDRLRPEARAVVLLVDVDGLPYDEVAARLGVAPGTVGSRLNRAHQALRQLLGEETR